MKQAGRPDAIAHLRGGRDYPEIQGVVRFYQRADGVLVEVRVRGLPRTETGFFAFHIHAGGSCAGEGFPESGSHFDPGHALHPNHAGDLPPMLGDFGRAYLQVLTGRFLVGEVLGKTVILHAQPDDFHTQPSGNAGTKIACGVIRQGY